MKFEILPFMAFCGVLGQFISRFEESVCDTNVFHQIHDDSMGYRVLCSSLFIYGLFDQ